MLSLACDCACRGADVGPKGALVIVLILVAVHALGFYAMHLDLKDD